MLSVSLLAWARRDRLSSVVVVALAVLVGACATPSANTRPPATVPTSAASTAFPDPDAPPVSVSQFNSIRKGMSFSELLELLGPPSRDLCSGRVCLEWRCVDGRRVVATSPLGGGTSPDLSFE